MYEMKPNPGCTNKSCCDRQVRETALRRWQNSLCVLRLLVQAKYNEHVCSAHFLAAQAAAAASSAASAAAALSVPLHAENEWNISVVGMSRCYERSPAELRRRLLTRACFGFFAGDDDDPSVSAAPADNLPAGLQFSMPEVRVVGHGKKAVATGSSLTRRLSPGAG
jgi:hypothetical protein